MRSRSIYLLTLLTMLVTSCSSGTGILEITDSWAPTTPPGAQAAVVYLTIANGTGNDDRLVSVATDRCGVVELHATQFNENRVMRMRLAEPELLAIPAGETLEMIPGALHVMCIAPTSPFQAGEELELIVTLEIAGDIGVTTEVSNR